MNKILKSRLQECDIEISDIISAIENFHKNDVTVIYTSHLEGLGTNDSDFDIYVISEEVKKLSWCKDNGKFKVQNKLIKDKCFDIEYWKIEDVEEIIENSNKADIANLLPDSLKLIQRLFIGEKISNNKTTNELVKKVKESKFENQVVKMYLLYANSALEDSINLFNGKEYFSALKSARDSLDNSIAALNARNGFPNLKPKWIPKIFIKNKGYGQENLDRYLKLQFFSSINNENIGTHIKEMLEFSQNILSNVVLKS